MAKRTFNSTLGCTQNIWLRPLFVRTLEAEAQMWKKSTIMATSLASIWGSIISTIQLYSLKANEGNAINKKNCVSKLVQLQWLTSINRTPEISYVYDQYLGSHILTQWHLQKESFGFSFYSRNCNSIRGYVRPSFRCTSVGPWWSSKIVI